MKSRTQPTALTNERLWARALSHSWPAEKPQVPLPDKHLGWLDEGVRRLLSEELSADTRFVVELGAWLGLTTRFLADLAANAVVVTIDHWQGSTEHHKHPEWQEMLPTLHETFLALCWEYRERVVPLRMTTLAGLKMLSDLGLSPELIYVDAEHSYQAVLAELELSHELFPQAVLVGDDHPHPPVRTAVEEFARCHDLGIKIDGNGWKLLRHNQEQEQ